MINQTTVKLDSGATRHYFKHDHKNILTDLKHLQDGPVAQLPNNSFVRATYEGIIKLHPDLSTIAQKVLVFPELKNESLISISQLTNDGCEITFDKNKAIVHKNNKILFEGVKNKWDNLYDLTLPIKPPDKMNVIIRQDQTKLELAQFLHATAFSPAISTFQKAIRNGNFVTWPGINAINFEKVLKTTMPTEQGHLDQERKGLQSQVTSHLHDDPFPPHTLIRSHERYTKSSIHLIAKTCKKHTWI